MGFEEWSTEAFAPWVDQSPPSLVLVAVQKETDKGGAGRRGGGGSGTERGRKESWE